MRSPLPTLNFDQVDRELRRDILVAVDHGGLIRSIISHTTRRKMTISAHFLRAFLKHPKAPRSERVSSSLSQLAIAHVTVLPMNTSVLCFVKHLLFFLFPWFQSSAPGRAVGQRLFASGGSVSERAGH